jgi:hypothetical protein
MVSPDFILSLRATLSEAEGERGNLLLMREFLRRNERSSQ